MKSVPKSRPLMIGAYRGRSTESAKPPVVATTICTAHVPFRPRLAAVAPRRAVREECDRMADRVERRRDRRLREPEDRTDADDDEPHEQQRMGCAHPPPDARLAPLGLRDQSAAAFGLAHRVLQDRVARR